MFTYEHLQDKRLKRAEEDAAKEAKAKARRDRKSKNATQEVVEARPLWYDKKWSEAEDYCAGSRGRFAKRRSWSIGAKRQSRKSERRSDGRSRRSAMVGTGCKNVLILFVSLSNLYNHIEWLNGRRVT
jgi:hypothetical protein